MTTPTDITFLGGQYLCPDQGIVSGDLHVKAGKISSSASPDRQVIDCAGLTLLPGMIDIHGDAFEKELFPRAGVKVPLERAMHAVDRQLLSNGITTAYHGVSLTWEPGSRDINFAAKLLQGMQDGRQALIADHRVQLRWEVLAHHAIPLVLSQLATSPRPALAFNDHATETFEYLAAGEMEQIDKWAARVGVLREAYIAAVHQVAENAAGKEAKIAEVASKARAAGVPMLAHDETTANERRLHRDLGMTISEFPLTAEAAGAAAQASEFVAMGAPNAVRGLSHKDNISAYTSILDGQCNILASDYHYPSLLAAIEKLVGQGDKSLPEAWDLVSTNPARALNLEDRGQLQVGKRADILAVDTKAAWRVVHVAAGGALTSYASAPA